MEMSNHGYLFIFKYALVGAFSLFLFPNFSKECKGALLFLLPALGVG
jgi:hypothetical protein